MKLKQIANSKVEKKKKKEKTRQETSEAHIKHLPSKTNQKLRYVPSEGKKLSEY